MPKPRAATLWRCSRSFKPRRPQLPPSFVLVIAAIVVAYAILAEAMKAWFFRLPRVVTVVPARPNRRILRIASRWVKARRR
ncbi:MAG TPA: hypothetical protein VMV82_04975 [Candidatus Dormibacteraeota bacterium]|nr:hypothetical protein [Candidatus Dormibacteraeota bacterium]